VLDFPNSPTTGQIFNNVWVWDGVKWAAMPPPFNDVGRNLLHNPLFNIAQRGAGPWTANFAYTLDRWILLLNTDAASINEPTLTDADRTQIGDEAALRSLRNIFTGNAAAAAYNRVTQPIEGVRRLSGKTVTVSFWASSTTTLKLGISLDQLFGTGGSPSAAVNGNGQAVTLSTTWTRYSLTFALPSVASMTLGTNGDDSTNLSFWYSSGATNAARSGSIGVQAGTVGIWGVQLEVGSVATPLEKLDPQQDLAKCQRFYAIGSIAWVSGSVAAGTAIGAPFSLPVSMRVTPTLTYADTGSNNITSPGVQMPGVREGRTNGTVNSTGSACVFSGNYTASADL
jgi:hypothetical protein